jgi:hypothetical protein
MKAESMENPVKFLRGVYRSEQAPDQLRVTAAIALLPFTATRCTDRCVSRSVDLPRATTVEQCLENIAELKDRVARAVLSVIFTTTSPVAADGSTGRPASAL